MFVEEDLRRTVYGVVRHLRWEQLLSSRDSSITPITVRLPTPALPECTPLTADRRSIRSVFWYSETDVLPTHLARLVPGRVLLPAAPAFGPRILTSVTGEGGERRMAVDFQSQHRRDYIPDSGGVSVSGQEPSAEANSGGALGFEQEEVLSQDSFETAISQGYRTEEEEENWDTSISMVHLGWLNVELKSDDWVSFDSQASAFFSFQIVPSGNRPSFSITLGGLM